eukprot:Rhum_TRINITY_DN10272_c0_g1::Rhum_TRINITY_DN10272_c0_g1_i1::g.37633::m.37633
MLPSRRQGLLLLLFLHRMIDTPVPFFSRFFSFCSFFFFFFFFCCCCFGFTSLFLRTPSFLCLLHLLLRHTLVGLHPCLRLLLRSRGRNSRTLHFHLLPLSSLFRTTLSVVVAGFPLRRRRRRRRTRRLLLRLDARPPRLLVPLESRRRRLELVLQLLRRRRTQRVDVQRAQLTLALLDHEPARPLLPPQVVPGLRETPGACEEQEVAGGVARLHGHDLVRRHHHVRQVADARAGVAANVLLVRQVVVHGEHRLDALQLHPVRHLLRRVALRVAAHHTQLRLQAGPRRRRVLARVARVAAAARAAAADGQHDDLHVERRDAADEAVAELEAAQGLYLVACGASALLAGRARHDAEGEERGAPSHEQHLLRLPAHCAAEVMVAPPGQVHVRHGHAATRRHVVHRHRVVRAVRNQVALPPGHVHRTPARRDRRLLVQLSSVGHVRPRACVTRGRGGGRGGGRRLLLPAGVLAAEREGAARNDAGQTRHRLHEVQGLCLATRDEAVLARTDPVGGGSGGRGEMGVCVHRLVGEHGDGAERVWVGVEDLQLRVVDGQHRNGAVAGAGRDGVARHRARDVGDGGGVRVVVRAQRVPREIGDENAAPLRADDQEAGVDRDGCCSVADAVQPADRQTLVPALRAGVLLRVGQPQAVEACDAAHDAHQLTPPVALLPLQREAGGLLCLTHLPRRFLLAAVRDQPRHLFVAILLLFAEAADVQHFFSFFSFFFFLFAAALLTGGTRSLTLGTQTRPAPPPPPLSNLRRRTNEVQIL